MLQGFRWQLIAFVSALAVFVLVLLSRMGTDQPVESEPTPTTNNTIVTATASPEATALVSGETGEVVAAPVQVDPIPTYREALIGGVQRLNPVFAGLNPVDEDIISLIFEGLTGINEYGEIVPVLAEEWVVSFDGLEYVVVLRDDVIWQDGTAFTAHDVAYTTSILGSSDFAGLSELGQFWRTVETEVINDHLVRFRLAQPSAIFLEALRVGILPYHALQGTNAQQLISHPFNLDPVGTGPYQLEALRTDGNQIKSVDLRAAPTYRERPEAESAFAIERISFHLYDEFSEVLESLRTSQVDGYAARNPGERLPLLELTEHVSGHTTIAPSVGMLIFNWVDDEFWLFREQRIRQALARGLDRSSLIERQLLNLAVRADSPLLPLSWAYAYDGVNLSWPRYDLAQARSLLETVNIPEELRGDRRTDPSQEEATEEPAASEEEVSTDEDNGALFTFTILTIENPALVNVAQEIAAQWSQLNLHVEVEVVDLDTYQARLESADFDTALIELSNQGSADPDVYAFWHEGQYPDGKNYGGVSNRRLSEALENARRDHFGINRIGHYRQFQQDFVESAVAIPLYYPLYTYAVSNNIQGVQLGFIGAPRDRFLTLRDWRID